MLVRFSKLTRYSREDPPKFTAQRHLPAQADKALKPDKQAQKMGTKPIEEIELYYCYLGGSEGVL